MLHDIPIKKPPPGSGAGAKPPRYHPDYPQARDILRHRVTGMGRPGRPGQLVKWRVRSPLPRASTVPSRSWPRAGLGFVSAFSCSILSQFPPLSSPVPMENGAGGGSRAGRVWLPPPLELIDAQVELPIPTRNPRAAGRGTRIPVSYGLALPVQQAHPAALFLSIKALICPSPASTTGSSPCPTTRVGAWRTPYRATSSVCS